MQSNFFHLSNETNFEQIKTSYNSAIEKCCGFSGFLGRCELSDEGLGNMIFRNNGYVCNFANDLNISNEDEKLQLIENFITAVNSGDGKCSSNFDLIMETLGAIDARCVPTSSISTSSH